MPCGHTHNYQGRTSMRNGHRHGFEHTTGCVINLNSGRHVHKYSNRTTYNDGHRHQMSGTTGPNYRVPGRRGHRHRDMGVTSFEDRHRHPFRFVTFGPRY